MSNARNSLVKKFLLSGLIAVHFLAFAVPARAGFLDKLNAATQKLNEASQKMQQKSQQMQQSGYDRNPDGTCVRRSATCMDYNVTMDNCMAPLKGYRSKIT